jgi:hypothetical protein
MDPNRRVDGVSARQSSRVLVVADWAVDARGVLSACPQPTSGDQQEVALLVPAWLHGLDWIGDPRASMPCAGRQLETIVGLAAARGVEFTSARVGDADVLTSIGDVLASWPADELLLCSRARRWGLAHPLDLEWRARRLTGLPVRRVEVSSADRAARVGASMRWRSGHCATESGRTALT